MVRSNSSCAGVAKSIVSVSFRSGRSCCSFCASSRTRRPTSTSLSPRLRLISKPTISLPSSQAEVLGSSMVSETVPRSPSMSRRPSPLVICTFFSCSADFTRASTRVGCLPPAMSAWPPALSIWLLRSCSEMAPTVSPSARSRVGSRSTCTWRVTPPTRVTLPTPFRPSNMRLRSLSTNQDSSWMSIRSDWMA